MYRLTALWTLLAYCANIGNAQIQPADRTALLTTFPSCATQCFLKIVPATGCGVTDFDCLCAHSTFGDESVACFSQDCTAKDTLRATNTSTVLCDWPIRDDSRKGLVSIVALTGLAFLCVFLRITARNPLTTKLFGVDDGLIVIAFVLTIPLVPTYFLLANHGLGRDIYTLPFNSLTEFLKLFYMFEIWYMLGVNIMKLSILFFYLRVFPHSKTTKAAKITCWVVVVQALAFLGIIFLQCWPISDIWTRWTGETEGKCVPMDILYVHAALNIALDLWILLLPLPKLSKLQLNYTRMKKFRVLAMFFTGVFVTFTSIVRMITLAKISYSRPNFTYDFNDCALWSGIEAWTGIITACMPALRGLFVETVPKWLASTKRSQNKSYGNNSRTMESSRQDRSRAMTPAGNRPFGKDEIELCDTDVRSTASGSEVELTAEVGITALPQRNLNEKPLPPLPRSQSEIWFVRE